MKRHLWLVLSLTIALGARVGMAQDATATPTVNPALETQMDQLETATRDLVGALLAPPRESSVETKALLLRARQVSIDPGGQHAAERAAQVRVMRGLVGAGD